MTNLITSKEREDAFRKDLKELLSKHNAELQITDDGRDWGMHSGIAIVSISSEFDSNGDLVAESTEFQI